MVCSGGDTGITPNKDLDCAGTCGKSEEDSCGVCQIIGKSTRKDCNGDCLGTAEINECGICVGGKTGKPSDQGK